MYSIPSPRRGGETSFVSSFNSSPIRGGSVPLRGGSVQAKHSPYSVSGLGMGFSTETRHKVAQQLGNHSTASERLHLAREDLKNSINESMKHLHSPRGARSPRLNRVASPRAARIHVDENIEGDFASVHISKLQNMVQDKMEEQSQYENLLQNKDQEKTRLVEVVRTVELQKKDLEYSLQAKDQEIDHLQKVIHSLKTNNTVDESTLRQHVSKAVSFQARELEREIDAVRQQMLANKEVEIRNLEAQHQEHIIELTQRYESKLSLMENEWNEKVGHIQREHDQLDEVNIRRLRKLEQVYQEQIQNLQNVLTSEKQSNESLREELRSVHDDNSSQIADITRALSKKDTELSIKTRMTEQLQRQVKESDAQMQKLRQDYDELLKSVREEALLQSNHLNHMLDAERKAVKEMKERMTSVEASYVKKLHDTASKLDQVNAVLREQQRVSNAHTLNQEGIKLAQKRLEQENSLLREEISMLDSEHKRLSQESARFKGEVMRLERIIYGKPRVNPESGSTSSKRNMKK